MPALAAAAHASIATSEGTADERDRALAWLREQEIATAATSAARPSNGGPSPMESPVLTDVPVSPTALLVEPGTINELQRLHLRINGRSL